MHKYRPFTQRTREGELGSTAQYWAQYIKLVHRLQLYSRGYRTNNLDLFVYELGCMKPAFFAGNHTNYACWMIYYNVNIRNIDTSHPGLRQVYENGVLSTKRANLSFSRCAVDMALRVKAYMQMQHQGLQGFLPLLIQRETNINDCKIILHCSYW